MIAKLRGILDSVGDDWIIVDVGGVGYHVHCASRTLSRLPAVGEGVVLHVETDVGEDHIRLFGFLTESEKAFFRLITTVQGVGSKVGLSILSVAPPDQLAQAVAAQDKTIFARASGVGPKLAQRIVTELKDKVAALALSTPMIVKREKTGEAVSPLAPSPVAADGPVDEAVSALVNLGYGRMDAFAAVSRAMGQNGEAATVQALIGAALRDLGKGL